MEELSMLVAAGLFCFFPHLEYWRPHMTAYEEENSPAYII
jgi:hypothetical protein